MKSIKNLDHITIKSMLSKLWSVTERVTAGEMSSETANAVASNVREMIKAGKLQLDAAKYSQQPLPNDALKMYQLKEGD